MHLDKVAVRAFLNTLYAIGILFVLMVLMLVCVYPSTLMEMSHDLGMDSVSIVFAKNAYDRTDEVYYIAYATECAIDLESDKKIAACGVRFIEDKQFEDYCAERNKEIPEAAMGTYDQRIYRVVCVAEYNLGDKTAALETAFGSIGVGFPRYNAVAALLIASLRNGDADTVGKIEEKMQAVHVEELSEDDALFFGEMQALLNRE